MRFGTEVDDTFGPVAEQDPQTRLGVGPFVDHEVALEGVGAEDPATGHMGDQFGPRCRIGDVGIVGGHEESEVDRFVVGVHHERVTPVVDAVLDVVASGHHDDRIVGGTIGGDDPGVGTGATGRLDDDPVV